MDNEEHQKLIFLVEKLSEDIKELKKDIKELNDHFFNPEKGIYSKIQHVQNKIENHNEKFGTFKQFLFMVGGTVIATIGSFIISLFS